MSISDQTLDTATAAAATTAPDSTTGGGELGFVSEDGDRNSGGGNRWPRQETVALIKIRSDMDTVFRDSSLKGPLWDDVSRKLAELGYQRSAKKCKEKFENVYKYHKRTKDGRVSKQDGKTYRFFEQLEALQGHAPTPLTASIQSPNNTNNHFPSLPHPYVHPVTNYAHNNVISRHNSNIQSYGNLSNSTSSSTSSELDRRGMKRKRKWKDFFERIMREVIDKQEALQTRFLESLERRERDRIVKEEAWRVQEMAKMNREHDLLVHERSISAAKDAAIISFLQKMTEETPSKTLNFLPQNSIQVKLREISFPQPTQTIPPVKTQPIQVPVPVPVLSALALPIVNSTDKTPSTQTPVPVLELSIKSAADNTLAIQSPIPALTLPIKGPTNIVGDNSIPPSPSRWPKTEIQALINLRTTLDMKYQENGPKGPLWEEISSGMKRIGYNRNAKRCKEKWENINKYYKKMKESNKKRPQDAKTCPYFDQLDAIYNEKAKNMVPINHGSPIMARPEQQWPLVAPPQLPPPNVEKKVNDEDEESGEDENEEDEIDGYEIVENKPSSMEN